MSEVREVYDGPAGRDPEMDQLEEKVRQLEQKNTDLRDTVCWYMGWREGALEMVAMVLGEIDARENSA